MVLVFPLAVQDAIATGRWFDLGQVYAAPTGPAVTYSHKPDWAATAGTSRIRVMLCNAQAMLAVVKFGALPTLIPKHCVLRTEFNYSRFTALVREIARPAPAPVEHGLPMTEEDEEEYDSRQCGSRRYDSRQYDSRQEVYDSRCMAHVLQEEEENMNMNLTICV